jgi:hypothetical protein
MYEQGDQGKREILRNGLTRKQVEESVSGASYDCISRFEAMVKNKNELEALEEVKPVSHYIKELQTLTKLYRQVIRAVVRYNSLGDPSISDHHLRIALPTVWNSLIILIDQIWSEQENQIQLKSKQLQLECD